MNLDRKMRWNEQCYQYGVSLADRQNKKGRTKMEVGRAERGWLILWKGTVKEEPKLLTADRIGKEGTRIGSGGEYEWNGAALILAPASGSCWIRKDGGGRDVYEWMRCVNEWWMKGNEAKSVVVFFYTYEGQNKQRVDRIVGHVTTKRAVRSKK